MIQKTYVMRGLVIRDWDPPFTALSVEIGKLELLVRGPGGETLPLGGILGTYIVLKHSLRVFQIRLFALVKWRRLAVRPHSLCEAKKKKPQGAHVVVFESYT